MFIIRWWRVQRARALLRVIMRTRLPDHHLVPLARYMCGDSTPPEIKSAIEVIETRGAVKPAW